MDRDDELLRLEWLTLHAKIRERIERLISRGAFDSLYASFLLTQLRTLDDEARTLLEAIEDADTTG